MSILDQTFISFYYADNIVISLFVSIKVINLVLEDLFIIRQGHSACKTNNNVTTTTSTRREKLLIRN